MTQQQWCRNKSAASTTGTVSSERKMRGYRSTTHLITLPYFAASKCDESESPSGIAFRGEPAELTGDRVTIARREPEATALVCRAERRLAGQISRPRTRFSAY